jgi:hypothetical protein
MQRRECQWNGGKNLCQVLFLAVIKFFRNVIDATDEHARLRRGKNRNHRRIDEVDKGARAKPIYPRPSAGFSGL